MLEEQGARVLSQPAIDVLEPDDWSPVDRVISRLDEFDWVVFSSVNGVRAFLTRLEELGRDLRALGHVRLAAIGPATARAVRGYHLRVDCQPPKYQAEQLAEALATSADGKRFLLVRASRGRDVLARQLTAAGAVVTQVVAYRSVDVEQAGEQIVESLRNGEVDWITVTSSAIARSLVALFGGDLAKARLASISPLTSGVLRELGRTPAAEAGEATMEGVVKAIMEAEGPQAAAADIDW
jgi:uroporphyrinogen III methyltransferase/synthase